MRDRRLPALAGLVFLVVCAWNARADEPFNGTPAAIHSKGDPIGLRSADFDRDGDQDLMAATSSAGGEITWYENDDGSGTSWTDHTIALTIAAASQAFPVDLDQDGDMDVVAVFPSSTSTVWFENTSGDGSTWSGEQLINDTSTSHASAVAADFDRDGDLDVAIGNTGTVRWFVNLTGDASDFSAANGVGTLASNVATDLAAEDVDGDGRVDVVASWAGAGTSRVQWYRNTSSGFTDGTSLALANPTSVAASDFDRDGDVDFAYATSSNAVGWIENTNGAGTSLSNHPFALGADDPRDLSALDVDRDGDSDLVVVSHGPFSIYWYENTGPGGFARWNYGVGDTRTTIWAADLDGDGDNELLYGDDGDDEIAQLENENVHSRANYPEASFIHNPGGTMGTVATGDLDGDGDDDVVGTVSGFFTSEIFWRENDLGGSGSWFPHAVDSDFLGASDVDLADVDRDGDLDVIAASETENEVVWYANPSWTRTAIDTTRLAPMSASPADIDGDGDIDVLVAFFDSDRFSWFENTAGDGSAWTERAIATGANEANHAVAADVDRDGDLDVVGVTTLDNTVRWYENTNGAGTAWSAHVIASNAAQPVTVVAGDVDYDGDVDIVSAGTFRIAWSENTAGNGSAWTTSAISTGVEYGRALALADVDKDGDGDVLAIPGPTTSLGLFENTSGDGAIWSARDMAGADGHVSTGEQHGIAVADLTAGTLDVIGAYGSAGMLLYGENYLSQVRVQGADVAPAVMLQNTQTQVVTLDVTHAGRAVDLDLELSGLTLYLSEDIAAMTDAQANAVVDEVTLWGDDGDGVLDAGDELAATLSTFTTLSSSFFQSVPVATGTSAVRVSKAATRRYFVVARLTANAGTQPLRMFRLGAEVGTFPVGHSFGLLDAEARIASSKLVLAASPTSDLDGDGLRDLAETSTGSFVSGADAGTSAFDADSDDDGFSDGYEVVARTNPLAQELSPPRLPWRQLDASPGPFTCGLFENGEVSCFGDTDGVFSPAPSGTFRQISVGLEFGCGLRTDDSLQCWTAPGSGWLDVPPSQTHYLSVAAGDLHVCAIGLDLELDCFGFDNAGELTPPEGQYREVVSGEWASCALDLAGAPVCWGQSSGGSLAAPANERFVHLAMGAHHVCGLRADGSAYCWGSTESGETAVPPLAFTAIAAGAGYSCGLYDGGTSLICWGGFEISLGDFPAYTALTTGGAHGCLLRGERAPVCFGEDENGEGDPPAVALPDVAMGQNHGCSTSGAQRARCWGDNGFGQRTPPATGNVVSVGTGDFHSCAVEQDGDVVCFGNNANGESANQAGITDPFVQVDGGAGHTCGVRASGTATCWGSNLAGQSTPDLTFYRQVSAGGINTTSAHSCGINLGGGLRCWGTNSSGQATDQSGTWTQVSAGQAFTCGIRTDGTLGCFGANGSGQATPPPGTFVSVSAGRFHACALASNGTVRCWGDPGSGRTTPPPGTFARISSVGDATCGVLRGGSIVCWGVNVAGSTRPSLDADLDGREEPADVCPGVADASQLDDDGDGGGNACDVCADLPDPDQVDRDGDGIGDACDNCEDVPNPFQTDADSNGRGDACELTEVIVRRAGTVPPPGPPGFAGGPLPPPAPGDAIYEVYVACGATPIQRVELGVVLPQGTTPGQVSFGPGCTSTSCSAATGLGPTVNAALSRALGPGLATPGTRADTVYFSLRGSGAPDNRLCSPLQENLVARFELANTVIGQPTPNLTTEGTAPLGLQPLTSPTGTPLLPEEYAFVAIDASPTVAVTLRPAPGDATGRRWQAELESNLELAKMTFGVVAPAGTTTAQMRFAGCTNSSAPPATERACVATPVLGAYVSPATSFTLGPQAALSGLRTDTLYVSVSGARPSGLAQPALNVAGQPIALGVIELDTTSIQPALTLDGVSTTAVFGTPFLQTNGVAVATQSVQIGGGYNQPSDFDVDGRADDLDNCPFMANNNQANAGGFMTTVPDPFGDVCQCGEGEGNGTIFAADATAIRTALSSGIPASAVVGRCSVAGGPECDVRDYVILRRALAGLSPGINAVCSSAVRSTQLPAGQ